MNGYKELSVDELIEEVARLNEVECKSDDIIREMNKLTDIQREEIMYLKNCVLELHERLQAGNISSLINLAKAYHYNTTQLSRGRLLVEGNGVHLITDSMEELEAWLGLPAVPKLLKDY